MARVIASLKCTYYSENNVMSLSSHSTQISHFQLKSERLMKPVSSNCFFETFERVSCNIFRR